MQFNISYLDAAASSSNVLHCCSSVHSINLVLVIAFFNLHESVHGYERTSSNHTAAALWYFRQEFHLGCSQKKKTILKNLLFLHGSSNSVWQLVVIVAGVGRKLSTFYQIGCYLSQVEQLWQATCQKQQQQSAIKPKTDLSFFKGLDFTHPIRIECLELMQCLFFFKRSNRTQFSFFLLLIKLQTMTSIQLYNNPSQEPQSQFG